MALTNQNNVIEFHADDAASLFKALMAPVPRRIVLHGVVDIGQSIKVTHPHVQLSGPGTIVGGTISWRTHDIYAQNIIFSPYSSGHESPELDAGNINGNHTIPHNIEFHNCTFRYSLDEAFNIWSTQHTPHDITLRSCIIGPPANINGHGFGLFVADRWDNITVTDCLIASCADRGPLFRSEMSGYVQFKNNLVYEILSGNRSRFQGPLTADIVGNAWAYPSGRRGAHEYRLQQGANVYMADNWTLERGEWRESKVLNEGATFADGTHRNLPYHLPAFEVYEHVLATAGAWPRDKIDERTIARVKRGESGMINNIDQLEDGAL